MSKVQLKVNMIIGGTYYPFGAVLDENEVPPKLRTDQYITEGGGKEVESHSDEVDISEETIDDEESHPIEELEKPKKKVMFPGGAAKKRR